jgi:hypothetical protein
LKGAILRRVNLPDARHNYQVLELPKFAEYRYLFGAGAGEQVELSSFTRLSEGFC